MAQTTSKTPAKIETGTSGGRLTPMPRNWNPLDTLHQEIDRMFSSFGRDPWLADMRKMMDLGPSRTTGFSMPAVDVIEKEDAYEITADLPGMDEKNIDVRLSNGNLVIHGEMKDEGDKDEKDYHLHERRYGVFERTFAVPDGVDAEKIEAAFKNGVLSVTLPKKPEMQRASKKIAIKGT